MGGFEQAGRLLTVRPHRGVMEGIGGAKMSIRTVCSVFGLIFGAIYFTGSAFAQDPGCGSPPCSPNPVPCAHCTGTWTDNGGAVWTVSSNNTPASYGTYSVSGSVVVPNVVFGCPSITYSVSGSISQTFGSAFARGTTSIQWTASSPNPSASCGGNTPVTSMTYTGSILNDDSDTGSGTWASSSGPTGSFSM